MTNYWKKRLKLFLILTDWKTAFFSTPSNNLTNFFLLIWFRQFSTIFGFFFAGSIPWFHHLLRRYLYLPWHVFRSLRFLEAYSFGSWCICSYVILVGMGCYHLFWYVFLSIHLNKCQIRRYLTETWPLSTNS